MSKRKKASGRAKPSARSSARSANSAARRPATIGRDFDSARALRELKKRDPDVGRLIETIGPFRLSPSKSGTVFHWLLRSILYQQLNGKAAATIHSRVRDIFGGKDPEPRELLKVPFERLKAAGVSGNKALALLDLARAAEAGLVPDRRKASRMSDEEIVQCLLPIRGVGRWTVEMLLIFALGRTDVLAVDDFALRKAVMQLKGLDEMPKKSAFEAIGEAWRPHRTLVCWYLWRSLDQPS